MKVNETIKLQIMKVTVIPFVVDALGTFLKVVEKRLGELEIVIISTKAPLISARIRRRVLETKGDLLPLRLQ